MAEDGTPRGGERRNGPRSEARAENERLILEAAEQVFAENGFGGASMQMIADRAGFPKANLHYYFATKESLYRRVVDRIFGVWLEAADSFDRSDDPAEALASYIDAKMEISRAYPAGSKVWAAEVMHGAPVIQDYLETTLREWTATRVAVIERWIAEGRIAPVAPQHLLYLIWAATQHYADFQHQIETLNGGERLSGEAWAAAKRDVVALILRGVGLEPPERPTRS